MQQRLCNRNCAMYKINVHGMSSALHSLGPRSDSDSADTPPLTSSFTPLNLLRRSLLEPELLKLISSVYYTSLAEMAVLTSSPTLDHPDQFAVRRRKTRSYLAEDKILTTLDCT